MGNTGGIKVGISPGSTGNGVKGIPGNWVNGIHFHCIPGHCVFGFQTARLGEVWIIDPVEMALMEW